MWIFQTLSHCFIQFRQKASQSLISRKGLFLSGTIVLGLLSIILAISFNIIQKISEQDTLTTLGILRSTRAFDNINVEILHLIIFLNSNDRHNADLLGEQLNILDSRFRVLVRQQSLNSLPPNLRQRAVLLIEDWNELLPAIQSLKTESLKARNTEQINLIVQRLNHIHTDLTDLILQNQNLRFQQYEIISRDRQSMVSLFTEVFLLFLIIIGIISCRSRINSEVK